MPRSARRAFGRGRSISTWNTSPPPDKWTQKTLGLDLRANEALHLARAIIEAVEEGADIVTITVHRAKVRGGRKTTVTAVLPQSGHSDQVSG